MSRFGKEPAFSFPRERRLLKSADYQRVRRRGNRRTTSHLCFSFLRHEGEARLGISIGKAAGKAVRRNRIKRKVREFFRLHQPSLAGKGDVVVSYVAHTGAIGDAELQDELRKGLRIP